MIFYDIKTCRHLANKHWELAGLARQDGDLLDAARHTEQARKWDQRANDGGWDWLPEGETAK